MAPIFDVHHPWVFTFGVLGNVVSIFVYFAPLPTFIQIYKRKSTMGFHCVPYVVALFSAMLWMYYAFLKTNAMLLISINSFGCVIESIYIMLFLAYASKDVKKHTVKMLLGLNVGFFSAILLFTLFLVKDANRLQVVGWICVAISVSVFAAPLSIVFQVVRTKSVEFMPVNLSFFLILTAIMWFGYGILQKDLCIAIPNVFGFFLGILQMLLYGIYRKPTKKAAESKEKSSPVPEHVINIVIMGNGKEVHPIDSQTSGSDVDEDDEIQRMKKLKPEMEEEEDKTSNVKITNEKKDAGFDVSDEKPKPNEGPFTTSSSPGLVICAA